MEWAGRACTQGWKEGYWEEGLLGKATGKKGYWERLLGKKGYWEEGLLGKATGKGYWERRLRLEAGRGKHAGHFLSLGWPYLVKSNSDLCHDGVYPGESRAALPPGR